MKSTEAWNPREHGAKGEERHHVEREVPYTHVRESRGDNGPWSTFPDVVPGEREVVVEEFDEFAVVVGLGVLPSGEDGGVEAEDEPCGSQGGGASVAWWVVILGVSASDNAVVYSRLRSEALAEERAVGHVV